MAKLLKPAAAAYYFPGCDLDEVLPTLVPGPALGGKAAASDDLGKSDFSDTLSGDDAVTDTYDDLDEQFAEQAAEGTALYQLLYGKDAGGPDAHAATRPDASPTDQDHNRVNDPKSNTAPVDPKPANFAQQQKPYLKYAAPDFDASVPLHTGFGQPVMPRMMAPPAGGPYEFPRASAAGMLGYAPPTTSGSPIYGPVPIPKGPVYYAPASIPGTPVYRPAPIPENAFNAPASLYGPASTTGNPVYYAQPAALRHSAHAAPLCTGPPAGGYFGYPTLGAAPSMPTGGYGYGVPAGIVPAPPHVMSVPDAVYGMDPTMLELMADLAQDAAVQHMTEAVLLDRAAALAKASQRTARMGVMYGNRARLGPKSRYMV
ncbi:hypothetical protein GGF31_000838 [Allomyces arbusculus]|nr:hypothetical protein GGF31_000838 [Allomyces arbusculus]